MWKDEVRDLLDMDYPFLRQVVGHKREATSPLQDNQSLQQVNQQRNLTIGRKIYTFSSGRLSMPFMKTCIIYCKRCRSSIGDQQS